MFRIFWTWLSFLKVKLIQMILNTLLSSWNGTKRYFKSSSILQTLSKYQLVMNQIQSFSTSRILRCLSAKKLESCTIKNFNQWSSKSFQGNYRLMWTDKRCRNEQTRSNILSSYLSMSRSSSRYSVKDRTTKCNRPFSSFKWVASSQYIPWNSQRILRFTSIN